MNYDDQRHDDPAGAVGKGPSAGLLSEMIDFTTERLMELEVLGMAGAGRGERSPNRLIHRNGYPKPRPAGKSEELPSFLQRILSGESAGQH